MKYLDKHLQYLTDECRFRKSDVEKGLETPCFDVYEKG
jgi:hypothetical protein